VSYQDQDQATLEYIQLKVLELLGEVDELLTTAERIRKRREERMPEEGRGSTEQTTDAHNTSGGSL
jgi:hypothetical protein